MLRTCIHNRWMPSERVLFRHTASIFLAGRQPAREKSPCLTKNFSPIRHPPVMNTGSKKMTIEELKILIWRYFMSYWNNRRICTANGGLPPMVKRRRFLDALNHAT